jgi:hypothetical protein
VLEAGTHEQSMRLKAADLVRLTRAQVADICRPPSAACRRSEESTRGARGARGGRLCLVGLEPFPRFAETSRLDLVAQARDRSFELVEIVDEQVVVVLHRPCGLMLLLVDPATNVGRTGGGVGTLGHLKRFPAFHRPRFEDTNTAARRLVAVSAKVAGRKLR